jgi:hypothetical protein
MAYTTFGKEDFAAFRANARSGPIHMLNLIRLRAQASYPDGRQATGAEAYAAYGRDSLPVFSRLGGTIIWRGRFEQMLIGPSEENLGHLLHRPISVGGSLRHHVEGSRLPSGGRTSQGGGCRLASDQDGCDDRRPRVRQSLTAPPSGDRTCCYSASSEYGSARASTAFSSTKIFGLRSQT